MLYLLFNSNLQTFFYKNKHSNYLYRKYCNFMKKNLLEDFQYTPNQNFEEEKKKKHNEKSEKHKHHKKHINRTDNEEEKSSISKEKEEELQSQIEEFFKRDGVDIAPYAYKLAHVEYTEGDDTDEMKNARSLFYKKLNHDENSEGYVYGFEPDELIKLQSLISSESSINENKIFGFFEKIVKGYNNWEKKLINEN